MGIVLKALLYYGIGSVIAGAVMGAGFATNLARRISKAQINHLENMGAYVPLALEGIDGGMVAKSGERRPTIIYIHGRSANRSELIPLAQTLFDEGYNAVLWDSASRKISYGPREIDQIRRIVSSVRADPHVDPDRVHLAGFSLGAAMALGAAAIDAEGHIRSVVADSPYANLQAVAAHYMTGFGVLPSAVAWPWKTASFATARALHGIDFKSNNPVDWAERVSCPVLLIHGAADKRIPSQHSELIFERLRSPKELWLIDGIGHTQAFKNKPVEYRQRVLRFLSH